MPSPRTLPSLALAIALLGPACWASRRVHPRSAEELRRGYAWLAGGDAERAEIAFGHALEFDPDLAEGENGLGVVARSRGDLGEALRHFDRALAVDGQFAEGHANRGEALLARGDLDGAEGALRAALRLNPDLVEARLNLGRALLRRGLGEGDARGAHWARAREAYLHALATDPRQAAAHADLAFMDYLSGRPARAEASWIAAAEAAPGDADVAHGLCMVRASLDRCREAVAECERCLRLVPEHAGCARSLEAARECAGP